jgi:hypothetical protein
LVQVPSRPVNSPAGKAKDGFGCSLSQLAVNQTLAGSDVAIFRKATDVTRLDQHVAHRVEHVGVGCGDKGLGVDPFLQTGSTL